MKQVGRCSLELASCVQDSLWHCILTATTGCIDTFYSATSVTNLVARIDATVINVGFKGKGVVVHSPSRRDKQSKQFHVTFS